MVHFGNWENIITKNNWQETLVITLVEDQVRQIYIYILFQNFFCEEKLSNVWNTLKYFIVEMKSWKLNNYSTKNLQFNCVSYGLLN
jgi:hypothetical protein